MAKNRPGPGVHAGRADPDFGRTHGKPGCAGRVRGLSTVCGSDGWQDGGADLAPVFDGTDGGPYSGAGEWAYCRARLASASGGAGRQVLGIVRVTGSRVPLSKEDLNWRGVRFVKVVGLEYD